MARRTILLVFVGVAITQFAAEAHAVMEGNGPWVGEPFGLDGCAIVEEKITFSFQDSPARVAIDYELIIPDASELPLRIITAAGVPLYAVIDGQRPEVDSMEISVDDLRKLNTDRPTEQVNFPNDDRYTQHTLRVPTAKGTRRLHLEYDVKPSFSMDESYIEYRYHNRDVPRQQLQVRILVDPETAEAELGGCNIRERSDQWMTIDKVLDQSIYATANSIFLWRLKSAAAFADESVSGRRTAFLAVGLGLVSLGVVAGLRRLEFRRGPAFRRTQLGLSIGATAVIGLGCGILISDDGGTPVSHQRQMAMLANERFASTIADSYYNETREENERGWPLGVPISDLPGLQAAVDNAVSLGVGEVHRNDTRGIWQYGSNGRPRFDHPVEYMVVMLKTAPQTGRVFHVYGDRIEPVMAGCGDSKRDVIRDVERIVKNSPDS